MTRIITYGIVSVPDFKREKIVNDLSSAVKSTCPRNI